MKELEPGRGLVADGRLWLIKKRTRTQTLDRTCIIADCAPLAPSTPQQEEALRDRDKYREVTVGMQASDGETTYVVTEIVLSESDDDPVASGLRVHWETLMSVESARLKQDQQRALYEQSMKALKDDDEPAR